MTVDDIWVLSSEIPNTPIETTRVEPDAFTEALNRRTGCFEVLDNGSWTAEVAHIELDPMTCRVDDIHEKVFCAAVGQGVYEEGDPDLLGVLMSVSHGSLF
jgi:hypothetical protein